jgi:hypothetical protein
MEGSYFVLVPETSPAPEQDARRIARDPARLIGEVPLAPRVADR